MKRNLLFAAICFSATALLAADSGPKDEATAAAKKLAGASNYSWKTTTQWGNFDTTSEGKAVKDDATLLTMTFGDNTTEAAFKGKKIAVKTADADWRTIEEMNADSEGPGRFLATFLQNFKAPAAEAEDLSGKTKELKKEGDVISGELTDQAAKDLLAGGRPDGSSNAKGSIKFWVKDGALTKYEYRLQGTVNWGGEDRDVERTTTNEIKDVGATKLQLPEPATKKLS